MRLYDEIFKNTEGIGGARFTVAIGGGGYFEGVKTVGEFSPEQVVLYYPKESVEIQGSNLYIKKYCEGDLQLSGKIHAVRIVEGEPQTKRG